MEEAFDPDTYFDKIPKVSMPSRKKDEEDETAFEVDENGELIEKSDEDEKKQKKDKKKNKVADKEKLKEEKKKKKAAKAAALAAAKAGNVYVSGLPPDITLKDMVPYFSKCGIIKRDPETAMFKVKIYQDEHGNPKGDGLVSYFRPESVKLAIQLLDGSEIKPGSVITVKEATFEHAPKEKGKAKPPRKKPKNMKLYDQSKELSWDEDTTVHVVIKHLFTQEEAWDSPNFFKELEQDIISECGKLGSVEKVKIFERNPEGVATIKFADHDSAERCVEKMNGRFFAGRKLEAEYYDGFTNYHVEETDEQKEERHRKWTQWLDDEEAGEGEDGEKREKIEVEPIVQKIKVPVDEVPMDIPPVEVENVEEDGKPVKEVKDAPKTVLDFGTLVAPTRRRHRDEDEELEEDD